MRHSLFYYIFLVAEFVLMIEAFFTFFVGKIELAMMIAVSALVIMNSCTFEVIRTTLKETHDTVDRILLRLSWEEK